MRSAAAPRSPPRLAVIHRPRLGACRLVPRLPGDTVAGTAVVDESDRDFALGFRRGGVFHARVTQDRVATAGAERGDGNPLGTTHLWIPPRARTRGACL